MLECYKPFTFESKHFEGPLWSVWFPGHGCRSQKQICWNLNERLHIYPPSDCCRNLKRQLGNGWNVPAVKRFLALKWKRPCFPSVILGQNRLLETKPWLWMLKQLWGLCPLKTLKLVVKFWVRFWVRFWAAATFSVGFRGSPLPNGVRQCVFLVPGPGCPW